MLYIVMYLFFCAWEGRGGGGNLVQSSALFWNFLNCISESCILLMHGLGKMHWLMVPWEVVQNHHQTIFNLRSVINLKWSSCDFCFPVIIINLTLFSKYLNSYFILSDSLFGDRQHPCDERELCSAPRIHGHSWKNVIRWNVLFFG